MVQSIDLKPLSEETIAQMGYESHSLWLVKIGSVVFGPFETESLKHYVSDNEHLFDLAEASHIDEKEWKPFWSFAVFQRRKPQAVAGGEPHEGPFWIMYSGLKTGPFNFREIDKKIEMGLLVMTDHISVDNGETWKKIFEIEGFDRRSHCPDDLPAAPYESSFQKAKLALVEKMESPHSHPSDELAAMAWSAQQQGKVLQFKMEEMTLNQVKNTEVSGSLKWAVPAVAVVVLAFVSTGYYMFSAPENRVAQETNSVKESAPNRVARPSRPAPRPQIPTASPSRFPASSNYPRPTYNQPPRQVSRFPTHVESHAPEQHYDQPAFPDREPLQETLDADQQREEHSLVDHNPPQAEPLDHAMNAALPEQQQPQDSIDPIMDRPVVEEVSDF